MDTDLGEYRTTIRMGDGPEIPVDFDKLRDKLRQMPDGDVPLEHYVSRLMRLSEEKAALATDIKELAEKAAGDGFNKKALMVLVKQQMESAEQRAKRITAEDDLERMKAALGVFQDTPLGSAAMQAPAG